MKHDANTMPNEQTFEVCELIHPTLAIATDLGKLMTHLSDRYDGSPLDADLLERTTNSPTTAQFIARLTNEERPVDPGVANRLPIIGSAVVSTEFGSLKLGARLQDFVVAPEARGSGAAQQLWDAMEEWRYKRDLTEMTFTSHPRRKAAHRFYLRNNCKIVAEGETTVFAHNLASNIRLNPESSRTNPQERHFQGPIKLNEKYGITHREAWENLSHPDSMSDEQRDNSGNY